MKKVLLLSSFILFAVVSAFSQTTTLSYQAVVRDSHNKFVHDTDIPVEVSILVGGTEKYYETRTAHTNRNGVISFSIGGDGRTWPVAGHPSEDLASVTGWHDASISVTFHLSDGDVTTNSPVSAVPYALEVNPTLLPTVNDATLTIQKNGATAGTFTANQATDQTVNITVPTCDSLNDCDLIKDILNRLDRLEFLNDSLASELDKMKPSLTVTASLDTVTVCSGSSYPVTYTATFHNCSSSDYTIVWKVNGTDSSNVTTPTLTFNAENAGDYKVVCTATRSDNSSLTDSTTTHVEFDLNVPSFTATVNTLTISLENIVNTDMLQWDTDSLPVVFDASSTTAEHTYSVADTITITATSANGCTLIMGFRLQPTAPTVTTDSIPTSTIAATTAKAYGTVTSDGGVPATKRGMVYSTSDQNLKIGTNGVDSVMANGTGKGNYACDLKRLAPCTQYYVRAFAFNDVDTAYGEVMNFTTLPFTCGNTLTDIDGNEYATLLLGSQCWMKQNLRTTHFADGTEIPAGGVDNHSGPRRYAPGSHLDTYGYLYNWDAAMNGSASSSANPSGVQGVCPAGWHLPSDAEWTQLTSFVASNPDNVCGNDPDNIAIALASTEGWETCSGGSTCQLCEDLPYKNNTQFSVLPAGTWHVSGGAGITGQGYSDGYSIFRSATEFEGAFVEAREFYPEHSYVERTAIDKTNGLSVRCVLTCPTSSAYLPTISTVTLSSTGATVSMTANVLADGGATVTERGVCWSTSQHPTTSSDHTADSGTGTGEFSVSGSLTPGTTYYVRAYATNSEGTAYGAEVTYVAPTPTNPPTVNTGSQFLALSEGFEGSTLPSSWMTIDNDGDGNNWTQQQYRANTGNGHAASASWDQGAALTPDNYLVTPDITLPTGISPILSFWFRGLDNNPSWAKEHLEVKVGSAGASTVSDFNSIPVFDTITSNEYVQKIVNLNSYAGQTIRLAFIHNNVTDMNQLLIDDIIVGVAGAGTNIVSDVTATTATCGGYVADDGGATVTARGVCWSTSQNPTVSDSHTTDGSGTGSFTSNITGLNALTTYYVREYATNSAGTTYGNQVSFTTPEALPKVTTSAVGGITVVGASINATCGGNVTDKGAYAVTARGVCWSTSQNPTVSDDHTTDGSGTGSFTSTITGLTSGTTYYVRAYATNSAGTAYGSQVTLTLPVVDTKSCSSAPVVIDHEGNAYATVQIGEQCWMRENLRTTTSPKTGTKVALPARNSAGNVYSSLGSKVAHWYACDETTYAPKGYGLLYNWCAAMDTANPQSHLEVPDSDHINGNNNSFNLTVTAPWRGICPAGWHIPSYAELNDSIIKKYNGGMLADGSDWDSSTSTTAPGNSSYSDRNSTGFTALPAGFFNNYNSQSSGQEAHFWSTWQMDGENGSKSAARAMKLLYNGNDPKLVTQEKNKGLSVRCVKD